MAMYDWNHDGDKDWQDDFIVLRKPRDSRVVL